ncbi:DUF475 domain-containing protein [Rudaea sp.]|uniref:DUF475 domain-containing protein n=1 Tax=Rudaea sp. TaxID=2136325 RepID=UPI0039E388BF
MATRSRQRGPGVRDFKACFAVTLLCFAVAYWRGSHAALGGPSALWLTFVLALLEIGLSFDNAVLNARVLERMSERWRRLFLTLGILVAVFAVRLVFPILIVSTSTGEYPGSVTRMAWEDPDGYARLLNSVYPLISAFGGSFLLLVFLDFVFDGSRDVHWIGRVEKRLAKAAKFDGSAVLIALCAVSGLRLWLPAPRYFPVLAAAVAGIILYLVVQGIGAMFMQAQPGVPAKSAWRANFANFLYLEMLDMSFSFDGVIGAFAVTRDIVVIALGLAVGAVFVRSLTLHFVRSGILHRYVYLEHGAHYAIGTLAVAMLACAVLPVHESSFASLVGAAFIAASIWSSIARVQREARGCATRDGA